ncbi:Dihydroorotate reductase PyrE [Penicillium angulare]|uniref:Dihydroorotate reductase PyrE n=1 Tax=Penicillium angulare TaxID=116970 RepID=UPI0025412E1E|nr:Dihydroorotate reductase PyrE [Penicillium angulare]KAJ5273196.1 Dihydroorotate reductase PyrE [Penicillium angulare]
MIAFRAGLRARSLPASRWTQRPSALLPRRTERLPNTVRYASESAPNATANAAAAAETVKEAPKELAKRTTRKSRKGRYATGLALVLLVGYVYGTDTRASIHRYAMVPLIRAVYPDAEDAHHFGVDILKELYQYGLHPRERGNPDRNGDLSTEVCIWSSYPDSIDYNRLISSSRFKVFGHTLANPIGISAGLDKHGEIPDPLFDLGPAIVEIGGTTPLPQDGNPKPRVFRVPSQNGMINRYGLNSKGADNMAAILKQRVRDFAYATGFGDYENVEQRILNGEANVPPGSLVPGKLLAVQVAKNKLTPDNDIDAISRDYVYCVDRLAQYADILVVNVSSPNTPGLRDLQATAPLTAILTAVVGSAKSVERKTKPHVMVKVSPDEDSDEQISGICEAVWNSGVDGIIVGNTTNRRPDPSKSTLPEKEQQTMKETGGYSGPELFDRSTALVARYRSLLDQGPSQTSDAAAEQAPAEQPRKVLFVSGGITNGQQALAALNSGASVAMMYTGITYGGIGTVTRVKQEMREELQKK